MVDLLPAASRLPPAVATVTSRLLPPPASSLPRRCRSYQVRRLADGDDYALKHIDLAAMDPAEYADLANEIR